jgi:hypothetical protein
MALTASLSVISKLATVFEIGSLDAGLFSSAFYTEVVPAKLVFNKYRTARADTSFHLRCNLTFANRAKQATLKTVIREGATRPAKAVLYVFWSFRNSHLTPSPKPLCASQSIEFTAFFSLTLSNITQIVIKRFVLSSNLCPVIFKLGEKTVRTFV